MNYELYKVLKINFLTIKNYKNDEKVKSHIGISNPYLWIK